MILDQYLRRIGWTDNVAVDLATLRGLHRHHLTAIPYENLDIHLGTSLPLELPRIFAKIVGENRGGWCFEMNALFAWALREIGFDVMFLKSRVGGPLLGTIEDFDHTLMVVQFEEPWLADVGFGNAILEPLPLRPGAYEQGGFVYRLEAAGDQWLFLNHERDGASYGFRLEPQELADFGPRCRWLQTSPESKFVAKLNCHRFVRGGIATLRGAVFTLVRADGEQQRTLRSATDLVDVMRVEFGLAPRGLAEMWPTVWRTHQEWVAREAEANDGEAQDTSGRNAAE